MVQISSLISQLCYIHVVLPKENSRVYSSKFFFFILLQKTIKNLTCDTITSCHKCVGLVLLNKKEEEGNNFANLSVLFISNLYRHIKKKAYKSCHTLSLRYRVLTLTCSSTRNKIICFKFCWSGGVCWPLLNFRGMSGFEPRKYLLKSPTFVHYMESHRKMQTGKKSITMTG
jgi:hypothetical protein